MQIANRRNEQRTAGMGETEEGGLGPKAICISQCVFRLRRMGVTLEELQRLIHDVYGAKDGGRGLEGTFMWFMEEVGELSAALRHGSAAERQAEFADVLAWLATLANVAGVDLEEAVRAKFGAGCPRCGRMPCECGPAKP